MKQAIRVILADDHALLRAGLRALLNVEPDIAVVGEAADGNDLLGQVESLKPDVVVLDLSMPVMNGLDALQYLTAHYRDVRTLILTMHSEEQYILRAIRGGAAGYVLKSAADVELIRAIREVYAGELHFDAQAMHLLLDYHRGAAQTEDRLETLSEREHEVLVLTVQGYSSREIGERLFISAKTVDTYRQRLMQKLGLSHRADLVQYALNKGLLDSPEAPDAPTSALKLAGQGYKAHAAETVDWDEVADVVVVGSGTALMAALRAADLGLSAVVLEKAAEVGGTMAISGGGLWIPNNDNMRAAGIADSRAEALEYIRHATLGQADPTLAEIFVDHCNQAIAFLREMGMNWAFMPTFNDYYPSFPGGKPRGRTLQPVDADGNAILGAGLTTFMAEAALARGVPLLLQTAAQQLVVDDDGVVVGVSAETPDGKLNIKARRGVVLGTGGFDHNQAMVSSFLRGPLYYTSAVPTNTGDGHLMGMAIGAGLRHMNERWGWPVFYDMERGVSINALATELGRPGAIVVNKRGQRMMNEAGPYDAATRAFYTFDTGTYEYLNIPSYVIIDSGHRRRYSLASFPPDAPLPGWIASAQSLDALAAALGIDPAPLAATVTRFNAFAARGIDPDYHRGESAFDQITGGDNTRADLANVCLAPISEPPFYGAPIWPGALGTSGGLHVNANAQVLNVWGKAITGLFAVGNTAGSPLAGGYPGGGGTLSAGLTFAYIAADYMAHEMR
jgi:DNA-binding NarL/FixJ family response regulator/succinate dehydrogenase/fumarate reductase flavoprotein subunit